MRHHQHRLKPGAEWPRRWHWYTRFGIEEPFPLLPVLAAAVVGVAIVPLLSWAAFELIDCSLEGFTP